MNLKRLVNKSTINNFSRFNGRSVSPHLNGGHRHFPTITSSISNNDFTLVKNATDLTPILVFKRYIHSSQQTTLSALSVSPKFGFDDSAEEEGEDETMNEFLSRFVWIMRTKLSEAYPHSDKEMIDGMLLIIVGKVVSDMENGGLERMSSEANIAPLQDFSEDLWRTVGEVSNLVLEDMEKERKKEKMKGFLQCEEVAEMCRFAGEIGIRGNLLRELRFKWARDKMEDSEFYESLECLRKEQRANEKKAEGKNPEAMGGEAAISEERPKVASLPKRHGKIKYKIYGLDLSSAKWAEIADKIHETGELLWPQEPRPISGKCKLVTEKILSLKEEDDPSQLLSEWTELLQPSRVDWISLLNKLKEHNTCLYLKVAEHSLSEKSFQATINDYSMVIDGHAKENHIADAERIITKMNENGVLPNIITATVLVHMYSKVGNIDRAKEAFESLRSHGFQPDMNLYSAMIMAYVNAGQVKLGESLMREMEARDIKPTQEIYMALLRAFSQRGDVGGAGRIATTMQFAGIQLSPESCALLIEAHGQSGDPDQARSNFDYMIKLGYRPDDRSTASMIAAYEKKNLLDKALDLLLQLEKEGFEPGPATCTVLVDWLGELQLVDEAEQLLGKIAEQGEAPPVKLQVSLCCMYAKAGLVKKSLQALGVLESKKEQLGPDEFERVIKVLSTSGYEQDAQRMCALMEAQGFVASENLKVRLASIAVKGKRPNSKIVFGHDSKAFRF